MKRVLLLSKERLDLCASVAKAVELVLERAASEGYSVPSRVYVEEVLEEELRPRLEAAALRVGASYGGLGPESCVIYVGWTGIPEIYVVVERCEELNHEVLRGEAMRAGAHSVLHRGVEYYVYTVSSEVASELYSVLGPSSSLFLYLVGAGVRGLEACSLLARLGFTEPAKSLAVSLRDAASYYGSEGRELFTLSKWLGVSEVFKLIAEAYPYAHLKEVGKALDELLEVVEELAGEEVVDAVMSVVEEVASFPARLGTAERMRVAAEQLVESLRRLAL